MALHQFNIFWQIAFWLNFKLVTDQRDEREWRGEFLRSSWEPSTWSSEPWNTERRERLHWETSWQRHSKHYSMSLSVSASVTQMFLIEIWDIDLNLPSPGQLHSQLLNSQSVIITVNISPVEMHYLFGAACYDCCVIETKARFPAANIESRW